MNLSIEFIAISWRIKLNSPQKTTTQKYDLFTKKELSKIAIHSVISDTLSSVGDEELLLLKSLNSSRLPFLSEDNPIILWKDKKARLVLVYGYDFYCEAMINDLSVYVCIKDMTPDDAKALAQHQAIMLPTILNFLSGNSMRVKRKGRKRKQPSSTCGLKKNTATILTGVFEEPKLLRRHIQPAMLRAANRLAPLFRVRCETVCRWLADLKLRARSLQLNPKPKKKNNKKNQGQQNFFERTEK